MVIALCNYDPMQLWPCTSEQAAATDQWAAPQKRGQSGHSCSTVRVPGMAAADRFTASFQLLVSYGILVVAY